MSTIAIAPPPPIATATVAGILSIVAQTIGGTKTFQDGVTLGASATVLNFVDQSGSATLSAANQGKIRYNNGTHLFEFSVNGGAYTAFASSGSSITVTAGTGLAGGGTVALGGTITLSLPSTGPGAGTIGSSTTPIASVTLDAQGRTTAASTYSPAILTASMASGQVAYATSGTALASSANLTWDNTNQLLVLGAANTTFTTAVTGTNANNDLIAIKNTSTSKYASIAFFDSSGANQGTIGWANSSVADTTVQSKLQIFQGSNDFFINRGSANVTAAFKGTGKVGINRTGPGAYFDVNSGDADGTTAVAMIVDTSTTWSNASLAKIMSFRNNTAEKLSVAFNGALTFNTAGIGIRSPAGTGVIFSDDTTGSKFSYSTNTIVLTGSTWTATSNASTGSAGALTFNTVNSFSTGATAKFISAANTGIYIGAFSGDSTHCAPLAMDFVADTAGCTVNKVVVVSSAFKVQDAAATANLGTIRGVASNTASSGQVCRVIVFGPAKVNSDAGIAINTLVGTSGTTAGSVAASTPALGQVVGKTLEATGGTSLNQVYVFVNCI